MGLRDTVMIALGALRLNAMRSFLTMLGIIIGIGSVIVMVSVSSGSRAEIEASIDRLGSNMLSIRPGTTMWGGRRGGSGSAAPFTEKDRNRLKAQFAFIDGISGRISSNEAVVFGNSNWTTSVEGVHPDYIRVRQWVIEEGRNLSDREVRTGGKVAIVGQDIIEQLFGAPRRWASASGSTTCPSRLSARCSRKEIPPSGAAMTMSSSFRSPRRGCASWAKGSAAFRSRSEIFT